mgnify:CR=1 FL=1
MLRIADQIILQIVLLFQRVADSIQTAVSFCIYSCILTALVIGGNLCFNSALIELFKVNAVDVIRCGYVLEAVLEEFKDFIPDAALYADDRKRILRYSS